MNSPSQRQPPSFYPVLGVIIPHGPKLDIVGSLVIRKYLLHTFIESLGKNRHVFGGVESRAP